MFLGIIISLSTNYRYLLNLLQNCLSWPDLVNCISGLISWPAACTQALGHITLQFLTRRASSSVGFSHVVCFGLWDVSGCDSGGGCGPAFLHCCHRGRNVPPWSWCLSSMMNAQYRWSWFEPSLQSDPQLAAELSRAQHSEPEVKLPSSLAKLWGRIKHACPMRSRCCSVVLCMNSWLVYQVSPQGEPCAIPLT